MQEAEFNVDDNVDGARTARELECYGAQAFMDEMLFNDAQVECDEPGGMCFYIY